MVHQRTILVEAHNWGVQRTGSTMPRLVIPKGSPRCVQLSLLRLLIKDVKTISEIDMADLCHAALELTYAHCHDLDSAWASYAQTLQLNDRHFIRRVSRTRW